MAHRLSGKFAPSGLGESPQTWQANAYGRSANDRRRVSARALGFETRPRRDADGFGDEPEEIPVGDLVLTRGRLSRGKLTGLRDALRGGVKADSPLSGYRDVDGKVVLTDGNHRAAVLRLEGATGNVPVRIADAEPVEKAGKPTAEEARLGRDAAKQLADSGKNPASWVADEEIWEKAKTAAAKTYEESDEAYWPAVVSIYQKMGGAVKSDLGKYGTSEGSLAGHAARGHDSSGGSASGSGWKEKASSRARDFSSRKVKEVKEAISGVGGPDNARSIAALDRIHSDAQDLIREIEDTAAEEGTSGRDRAKSGTRVQGEKEIVQARGMNLQGRMDRAIQGAKKATHDKARKLRIRDLTEILEEIPQMTENLGKAAPKGSMKPVAGIMADKKMDAEHMAEESGVDLKRVKALMAGEDEPTEAEMKAMMGAMKKGAPLSKADLGPSIREIEGKLHDAVRAKHGQGLYVQDVFLEADTVILRASSMMDGSFPYGRDTSYQAEFEMGDDGKIELGELIEVERIEIYEPIAKAVASTRLRSWLTAAKAKHKTDHAGLALRAGVSESILTGLENGMIAKLGRDEAKLVAAALGITVDQLDGALAEGVEAAGAIPEAQEPEGDAALRKNIEYVATHLGGGRCIVEDLNGEADPLAKALRAVGAEVELLPVAPDRLSLVFRPRGLPANLPAGRELLIKALGRVTENDETETIESDTRELPFLGSPESLAKAAEQGLLYAVAYAPGDESTPDLQGEWTDAEEIRKAAHAYLRKHRVIKRQHGGGATDDEVVESYIAPQDLTVNGTLVKAGSWVVGFQLGAESKRLVKAGKMKGVSIGGTKRVRE